MEGLDMVVHTIKEAVRNCFIEDDFDGILSAYRSSISDPEKREAFFVAFDEVMDFLQDVPHRRISSMAKVRLRLVSGGKIKRRLMDENGGDLCGLTLKNNSIEQYAILLPDASSAGKFRASYFDKRGFICHITRDSYADVLDEVFECGYTQEEPTALETLFNSPEWLNWYGGRGEALR